MIANPTAVNSLYALGALIGIEGAMLEAYAAQDMHGGVDDGWPNGSLWQSEGRALYALVRALGAERVVELGTWHGCSASHIAQALADAGQGGMLDSVDIWTEAGDRIPDDLRPVIRFHHTDMCAWALEQAVAGADYDLIYEDGEHDTLSVAQVWALAERLLRPGGVIVSHDALHSAVGAAVRAGIEASGLTPVYVQLGGSDCGMAIWRRD